MVGDAAFLLHLSFSNNHNLCSKIECYQVLYRMLICQLPSIIVDGGGEGVCVFVGLWGRGEKPYMGFWVCGYWLGFLGLWEMGEKPKGVSGLWLLVGISRFLGEG
ncbi:unnamed protein product [Prunus brigantina]